MSYLITSQEQLLKYIPNIVYSVDNEEDLYAKILPYVDTQEAILTIRLTGLETAESLSDELKETMAKAVVCRALADAIPSIDVVITPNGIGVVSTSEIAPASRERVERLITHLRDSGTQNISLLLEQLKQNGTWRDSTRGQYYCSTLASSIAYVLPWADRMPDILDVYDHARNIAAVYEDRMASAYTGYDVIRTLTGAKASGDGTYERLTELLEYAEQRFITQFWSSDTLLDRHFSDLWRTGQQAVNRIRKYKNLQELWAAEMPQVADPEPVVDKLPGAFFF